jgi:hypothetical protein
MKLTKENDKALRLMGFVPNIEKIKGNDDWWSLKGGGWTFRIDGIKNINCLVKRLMKTEYERGYEKGKEDFE